MQLMRAVTQREERLQALSQQASIWRWSRHRDMMTMPDCSGMVSVVCLRGCRVQNEVSGIASVLEYTVASMSNIHACMRLC